MSALTGTWYSARLAFDDAAVARVEHAVLEQRQAHAPHDAALQLAARRLRVEQPADAVGRDDARHADDRRARAIDAHFGEHRAERMQRVSLACVAGLRLRGGFDRRSPLRPASAASGFAPVALIAREQPSAVDRHASAACRAAATADRRSPARSACRAAAGTPPARRAPTLAAVIEPPETGACGSVVSPSSKRTCSTRHAERLGGDLRHHRVGAGADILRCPIARATVPSGCSARAPTRPCGAPDRSPSPCPSRRARPPSRIERGRRHCAASSRSAPPPAR